MEERFGISSDQVQSRGPRGSFAQPKTGVNLRRHGRGDVRMSLIIRDLEIIKSVIEDRLRFAFDDQLRQWIRLAAELKLHLIKVIQVDVAVSPSPDEFADVKIALLGDHMSQQRVGSDIEWDAEKYVRGS